MKRLISYLLLALYLGQFIGAEARAATGASIRGLLIPETEAVLSSEVAAQIKELKVKFGSRFKQGDNLIRFDCDINEAELRKARAELQELQSTHEVNKKLEAHLSISALEVAISAARLARAQAEVELKETLVDKCGIAAPFSGRVKEKMAHQHQYVTPGQPLLSLIDDTDLTLQLFVPSAWLTWLTSGYSFKVHMDEVDRDYQAEITMLGPIIDQVSQTLEVRARIKGEHRELLAGMSGTARFNVRVRK